MIHRFSVRTLPSKEGGWLTLSNIKYDNDTWMVTDEGKCVVMNKYPNAKPLSVRVTPIESFPPFEYDDAKSDAVNTNEKLKSVLFMHHHQVVCEGFSNPNLGTAVLFEIDDLSIKSIRDFKQLSLKRSALNKVWELNYRQKVDAFFYYAQAGETPIGKDKKMKSHREITMLLCDMVTKNVPFYDGKTYVEHFVSSYEKGDSEYILKTTILKALALGLMKKEGTAISFGDKIVGSSVKEVIVWLNANEEKKKFLFREVSQKDLLDVDDLDEAIGNEEIKVVQRNTTDENQEMNELRAKGKQYHILGAHNASKDKLLPKVIEAEALYKEATNMGINPEGLQPEKVKALIEAKKKEVKEVSLV